MQVEEFLDDIDPELISGKAFVSFEQSHLHVHMGIFGVFPVLDNFLGICQFKIDEILLLQVVDFLPHREDKVLFFIR